MNIQLNSNMLGGLKARRQKFGVGSLIFLLLFGMVFVGVGYLMIHSSRVDSNWHRVSGEVIDSSSNISDDSTTYVAVVKYSVEGREYRITSSLGSSLAPTIGETREIAYNPAQPNQAKVVESAGATWWVWLFPIIGIAILIVAPISFVKSLKRSGSIKNLTQTGQKLQGVLVDIQSMGSNNSAYRIVVAATDNSGAVHNYISDSISGIGSLAMADFRSNPIAIDVYIDPANPQDYYVDISDIPNLTPQRITELIQQAASRTVQSQTIPTISTQQPVAPIDDRQPPLSKL